MVWPATMTPANNTHVAVLFHGTVPTSYSAVWWGGAVHPPDCRPIQAAVLTFERKFTTMACSRVSVELIHVKVLTFIEVQDSCICKCILDKVRSQTHWTTTKCRPPRDRHGTDTRQTRDRHETDTGRAVFGGVRRPLETIFMHSVTRRRVHTENRLHCCVMSVSSHGHQPARSVPSDS